MSAKKSSLDRGYLTARRSVHKNAPKAEKAGEEAAPLLLVAA
jgi:hypothetical protein